MVAFVACLGCAEAALAEGDAQGPSPRKLGIAEAIQEYCKKAYPSSNEKWDFEVHRLTQGVSAETLEKVRASDAYRQARGAEATFVGQIEPINAKHVCARSLKKNPDEKPADGSSK